MRRVLNSILRKEFRTVQPCTTFYRNFLKLRFCLSGSYADRILVILLGSGFIKFYGGFEVNEPLLRTYLGSPSDDSRISGIEPVSDTSIDQIDLEITPPNLETEPKTWKQELIIT